MTRIKKARRGTGGFKGDKTRQRLLSTTDYTTSPTSPQPPNLTTTPLARPGDLLRRVYSQPPGRPITAKQSRALVNLINRIGRVEYRRYKALLDIPAEVSLARLSKAQAWRLIDRIAHDIEQQNNPEPGEDRS